MIFLDFLKSHLLIPIMCLLPGKENEVFQNFFLSVYESTFETTLYQALAL